MKRWGGFFGGLAVLALFGFGIYKAREAKVSLPVDKASGKPVTLQKGTPVQLILMESISSGGTDPGHKVRLAVLNDVVADGEVLIQRGSEAIGTVKESRGGSTFGFLDRKPARLSIELDMLQLPDGGSVQLAAPDGQPVLALDDSNTVQVGDDALNRVMADPKTREQVTQMTDKLLKDGSLPADIGTYQLLAQELGLKKTQELIDRGEGKTPAVGIGRALDALNRGDIASLTGIDGVLAAQALGELTTVAGSVEKRLRGVLKGHNIRANIGLPIKAELAEPVTLTPR